MSTISPGGKASSLEWEKTWNMAYRIEMRSKADGATRAYIHQSATQNQSEWKQAVDRQVAKVWQESGMPLSGELA
jgi:hypothetical protein